MMIHVFQCMGVCIVVYALKRVGGRAQPHLQTNYIKPFDLPVF